MRVGRGREKKKGRKNYYNEKAKISCVNMLLSLFSPLTCIFFFFILKTLQKNYFSIFNTHRAADGAFWVVVLRLAAEIQMTTNALGTNLQKGGGERIILRSEDILFLGF